MKIVLFVAGHTERMAVPKFLKRWLDPRLQKPLGIKPVRFGGWAELFKDVATKANMYLAESDVIAVISLLNLYGPTIYPAQCQLAEQREDWAIKEIEHRVGDSRFRHRFAMHEVEAWLLSQPDVFPREVRELFPPKVQMPEQDNFDEPPSYLLDRLYKQAKRGTYKKIVDGTQLFGKLSPEIAYLILQRQISSSRRAMPAEKLPMDQRWSTRS